MAEALALARFSLAIPCSDLNVAEGSVFVMSPVMIRRRSRPGLQGRGEAVNAGLPVSEG